MGILFYKNDNGAVDNAYQGVLLRGLEQAKSKKSVAKV